MALDYSKASGNNILKSVSEKKSDLLNSVRVVEIPLTEIDENPDNKNIFNMDDVDSLARSIEEEGFSGAIEVFKKPDGRYEISAGHRRYAAMKLLKRDTIPCIVSPTIDNIARAKKLLSSNIRNRVLNPLDMANSVDYYIEQVLKPSGFKGDVALACSEYFNKSRTQIFRYQAITKMIPELQKLSSDPMFPYTAFTSAAVLSKEQQLQLYNEIMKSVEDSNSTDGFEISRIKIEQLINLIKLKNGIKTKKKEEPKQVIEPPKQEQYSPKESRNSTDEEATMEDAQTEDAQTILLNSMPMFYEKTQTNTVQNIVHSDEYKLYLDDMLYTTVEQIQKISDGNYDIKDKKKVEEYIKDMRMELNSLELLVASKKDSD